jgi:hypothetical protein
MNSVSKVIALVVCMFSATVFAHAGSPIKTAVISATTGVYKVIYKSTETGNVKVSIFNASQVLVFTETLTNVSSFIRPYNFSDLSQGEYTIVVEDKNGKSEEKVSYHIVKVESTVAVAKIANQANKYILSVENTATDIVSVRIFDAAGTILHEQSMTVNGKFSVIYNLNQVKTAPIFEVTGTNGITKTIAF